MSDRVYYIVRRIRGLYMGYTRAICEAKDRRDSGVAASTVIEAPIGVRLLRGG